MINQPLTIHVFLPANRELPGFLRVYGPDKIGAQLITSELVVPYDIPCRGKADNRQAIKAENPDRDPTKPYGDAPSGIFLPSRISRFTPPRKTFGRWAIRLEGQSGQALEAKEGGRTGLAIHGNRGDIKLMATYGCIRVFERDMEILSKTIGDASVVVTVFEIDNWPLGIDGE